MQPVLRLCLRGVPLGDRRVTLEGPAVTLPASVVRRIVGPRVEFRENVLVYDEECPLWDAYCRMGAAPHLSEEEARLLQGLQDGRWGNRIRLEQERLDWPAVMQMLPTW